MAMIRVRNREWVPGQKGFLFAWPLLLLMSVLPAQDRVVVDWTGPEFREKLEIKDLEVKGEGKSLTLTASGVSPNPWPGMGWNFGQWLAAGNAGALVVEVSNRGTSTVDVGLKISSEGPGGKAVTEDRRQKVLPGTAIRLRFTNPALARDPAIPSLILMDYLPTWAQPHVAKPSALDFSRIRAVSLFLVRPAPGSVVTAGPLLAEPRPVSTAPAKPFPLYDAFGQYIHDTWPGKIATPEDFSRDRLAEERAIAKDPRPSTWNRWGGNRLEAKGPATGFFRVTNDGGRWTLVDPDGFPFFAHGVHGVRHGNGTPVTDRENYFAALPAEKDGVFGAYWETSVAKGLWHYPAGQSFRSYNFFQANLHRKYGSNWREEMEQSALGRLPHWGLNAIGAGSLPTLLAKRRLPYYAYVVPEKAPILPTAKGTWGNFYDVFDGAFKEEVVKALARFAEGRVDDPNLIGVGVDNELGWGGTHSLALWTLQCGSSQPAKVEFLKDLRDKYGAIGGLNRAWGTAHGSWEALADHTAPPKEEAAAPDLLAFNRKTMDRYFRTCKEAVGRVFPNHLYTGCRFAHRQPDAEVAAHRHCDVVSHNHYRFDVSELQVPESNPRPLMVTEFHFMAPGKGYFAKGALQVENEAALAKAYEGYLRSALAHPRMVGTFWFLYQHQPPSGRFNGENRPVGFVDMTDTPVAALAAAARRIGEEMYAPARRRAP